ncbi:hypothetical protein KIN20_010759 [Parelaphostrongylus tenuis]|uniref:Lipoprotein n=1 Tax=Parelaphostrongylus tenuis TaxID=148309 RepID=A0AAD5M8C9_PARTN|nr:hypothetical protein KIN20_010759 [Parelaphostrongylus tenuis]
MARLLTNLSMISLITSISTVLGCGVLPTGQASVRPFTVSDFTLPVSMVYSTKAEVLTRLPGIATSQAGARAFSQRPVMQTGQDRSAYLPDVVISAILGQFSVNITYEPLDCEDVAITLKEWSIWINLHAANVMVDDNAVTEFAVKVLMARAQMYETTHVVKITGDPASHT